MSMTHVDTPQTSGVREEIGIIGAGIIGLATAVRLAAAGYPVRVFDPAPISGATRYAGGMLAPAAEVVFGQDPLFPLMREAKQLYPKLLSLVDQHSDLPTGFDDTGTIVVGADRADVTHLQQLYDYQRAHDMQVEQLPLSQARRAEPALSTRLAGAVLCPDDAQVVPVLFAEALLDAAKNLGVAFIAEEVTAAEEGRITTAAGNIFDCAQVIWCAGLGVAGYPLRPVYGEVVRVAVPDYLYPLCSHVIRGFVEDRPIYLIPRPDRTIAIGATSREDHRAAPPVESVWQLLRDATRILPGIIDCDFLGVTTGARPGSPDDLPFLGRVDPHTVVSTGYFRHGILLAAFAAERTLHIIQGESGPDTCRPDRFATQERA